MVQYKYLIVGGGMTADAAISGIKDIDSEGSIALISAESHPPYNRPPLSKGLWKGKPLEKIFRKASQEGVDLYLGRHIESLDLMNNQAVDDRGEVYRFERLLLATGGSPIQLPFGGEAVIYFRTLDDYMRLHELAEQGGHFAVIGGGFIGSELACALADMGRKVSMVFPEEGIGARLFPRDLALFLNDYYRERGVEVLAGELVGGFEKRGEKSVLLLKSGREVIADHVVAGIGIRPNIQLAQNAGLIVENGIAVDEYLETSKPGVFAAGDVAYFPNPILHQRLRIEHEDNALTGGKTAGRNMAGERIPYNHLSYFYSDLFDLGYEAVGELDPRLETFADWQEPFKNGVIYYLKDGRVRGVLLWNIWDQVEAARRLIIEPGPFESADLKNRLPE